MSRRDVLWTVLVAVIVLLFSVGVFFLGRSSRESPESATQGRPGYSLDPGVSAWLAVGRTPSEVLHN